MCKYDVIHKTGNTQHITTPSEQDRATAIGNLREKIDEDQTCVFGDMIMDRQTHRDRQTERQTRSSQYSALPIGGGLITPKCTVHKCDSDRIVDDFA